MIENTSQYIGRASIDLNTGKIIEYQSGISSLGALRLNAINSGYLSNNIDEKYITEIEYKIYMNEIKDSQPQIIEEVSRITQLETEIAVLKTSNEELIARVTILEKV